MPAHGWTLRRRLGAALAGLLLGMFVAGVPLASAGSIAYLDGKEVWVSSLDGSRKERLSNGEGDWIAVAAADNGRVLGVRLEAGKIFQLARIQLWENNGQVISQGPLPSKAGWSQYVAPLGLDLTSDGVFAVYGYSGYTGIVPNAIFSSGHYAILSDTKTNLEPIGQSGYRYPTTFGRRVVAAQGKTPVLQRADQSNPFATDWDALGTVDVSGVPGSPDLRRTDVAATGTLALFELDFTGSDDRIGALSLSGINQPITAGQATDCFLPAVGEASEATISQDGTRIAWKDAQGVKIAGTPAGTTEPCALSAPPVVISATGSSPSIGGADVTQLRPSAPAPAPNPNPGPGPGGSLSVSVPAKGSAAALAGSKGLALRINVPAAGRVTASGSIAAKRLGLKGRKAILVATGSARATKAGTIIVRLKLTRKARKYRKRLRGATIVLRITQGGRTTTKSVRLR